MTVKRKLAFVLVLVLSIVAFGCKKQTTYNELYVENTSIDKELEEEITVYYTDENLKNFFKEAIAKYNEQYPNIKIEAVYKAKGNYLDDIIKSNTTEKIPYDLYLISHDQLEKAYLSGIAKENNNKEVFNSDNYASAAIDSITYNGKMIGYPLFYDTSCFVTNKMYREETIKTFDELTLYAETFEPTEEMKEFQSIFEWNVSDVVSNYAFIGGTVNITGNTGDQRQMINIYNDETIAVLKQFQNLKTYFSIDRTKVEDGYIMKQFLGNRTACGIFNTDELHQITVTGKEYEISAIPGININDSDENDIIEAKPLSITEVVVVNPYSKKQAIAMSFAEFLTIDAADMLYETAGEFSCKKSVVYEIEQLNALMNIYCNSVPKTKLMDLSELYMYIEIMFHNIWDGSSVEIELAKVKDYLNGQLKE